MNRFLFITDRLVPEGGEDPAIVATLAFQTSIRAIPALQLGRDGLSGSRTRDFPQGGNGGLLSKMSPPPHGELDLQQDGRQGDQDEDRSKAEPPGQGEDCGD